MRIRTVALLVVVLAVVAAGGALAWALRYPALAPIARVDPATLDRDLVERGQILAGFGNCHVCHTRQGGRPYAGGRALPTPFGTIYTTNLTPDAETGIGAWSEAAFIRAMREGVDRQGRYLYPAFPYDYFTKVSEDDLKAIYAYLMTLDPVSDAAPQNELPFPFNIRLMMAGWNLLFLQGGEHQSDPSKDEEWNRGAYLVEGLGHCGACHTPRNVFGAAAKSGSAAYDGGSAEGWYAPPLDRNTPAPIPWTQIALVNYLIDGWDRNHGIAAGPMTPVVNDLREQSEDDVFAIATYLMSLKGGELGEAEQKAVTDEVRAFAERMEWGHADNPPIPDDPVMREGARVYESQCVTCHKTPGEPAPLALSTVVNALDPTNLIRLTYFGIQPPPQGVLDRSMPPRATQISDPEMVALAAFIRARFTDKAPWQDLAETVSRVRAEVH